MNSYLLTRLFYRELEESEDMQLSCTPHHQALFFRIIQVQNQVGWSVKNFDLPTENTMFYACIGSYKTYKKCLADLMQWNLVEQLSESKNQYQARKISLYTEKWAAFIAQANSEQLPEQDLHTTEANTQADRIPGSMHSLGTDQSTANAGPVNKTNKLLNEETNKPLNLETSKGEELSQPIIEESKSASQIGFFANKNSDSNGIKKLPAEEKKKVAAKRKEGSAKLNEKLAASKSDLLFIESIYADKSLFIAAFSGSEYKAANLDYYYEIIKNWSESKHAKKKDWIATAKNWMLKDFKEGKLVTHQQPTYAKPRSTDTAGQSGFTVLGNAVDHYFERKFGK